MSKKPNKLQHVSHTFHIFLSCEIGEFFVNNEQEVNIIVVGSVLKFIFFYFSRASDVVL